MPRFDPELISLLANNAGAKCHARGTVYAEQGRIAILALAPDRVVAEAYGTETYSVRLTGGGKKIAGQCSCPAFDDAGFCKHMVAAMLVTNFLIEQGARTDTICEDIGNHLATLDSTRLRAYVQLLAETNTTLFRQLAEVAGADPRDDFVFD